MVLNTHMSILERSIGRLLYPSSSNVKLLSASVNVKLVEDAAMESVT